MTDHLEQPCKETIVHPGHYYRALDTGLDYSPVYHCPGVPYVSMAQTCEHPRWLVDRESAQPGVIRRVCTTCRLVEYETERAGS